MFKNTINVLIQKPLYLVPVYNIYTAKFRKMAVFPSSSGEDIPTWLQLNLNILIHVLSFCR
jgi:hypothetical protein